MHAVQGWQGLRLGCGPGGGGGWLGAHGLPPALVDDGALLSGGASLAGKPP